MLDMVKKELLRLGFTEEEIDGGGLKVTTTFTKKAMDAAQQAVQDVAPTGVKALHAAVASVDVNTGGVLGFFSGQDYLKSQIDWATTPLPTGSAFKPFAAAAGIKDGFSLKDTFQGDSPYTFPDGSTVVNEGAGSGHDYGPKVSLTMAMQESINTAFVDMTESMDNGPQKIADMAEALGVPKIPAEDVHARISLGGSPVSPMDMANAYAGIADGGEHHGTFVVSKVVRASNGEVLYTAPRRTDKVLDPDIAADTSYAMQQVVKSGTGTAARALGRPAAGKTGTATNNDKRVITSWFVGFTPQVATAVMYAHGTGYKPIDEGYLPRGYFGATYPAETWTAAMKLLMDGVPVEDFPPPANVDGKAPTSGHDPYTPPPPPKKPKKTKTVAPTTTAPPPSPTYTPPPPPSPTNGCPILNPNCNQTPTPSPTPTPTPTQPPAGRVAPPDPYARVE
jgi:membrane peptidoglycan carboxypeptidase